MMVVEFRIEKASNDMDNENYIENILKSTNGMVKVIPNDSNLDKIFAKLELETVATNYNKWLVAASIVLLISINALVLSTFKNSAENASSVSQLVSVENNQLY